MSDEPLPQSEIILYQTEDGRTRIENRRWKQSFRGWLAIHASAQPQREADFPRGHSVPDLDSLDYSAICGVARVVDIVSKSRSKWFYLMWCKRYLAEFVSISSSHATTMGHIKRGDLGAAMVAVPSPEELEEMSEKMTPLIDKKIENDKQRKACEELRDTLLPKLMSGEVRVAV